MTRAAWMLVLVAALWGTSFSWTKTWQVAAEGAPGGDLLSSLTLIGVRMALALVLLALWQPHLFTRPRLAEHAAGAAIGAVFFAGFLLQTWGLAQTTPALSAFLTALASAWVPLLCLLVGVRVPLRTLLGLAVAVAGCAVMVPDWTPRHGEWLTAIASVLFAVEMLLLDRLGKKLEPAHFTPAFFATLSLCGLLGGAAAACAGPGLVPWASWTGGMLSRGDSLQAVLLLAFLPTVLAFHWMNRFQPQVEPAQAALIYLLEPIFSAVVSVIAGHDAMTYPLVIGGLLVVLGNVVVVLGDTGSAREPPPPDAPPADP
ncbi:MAG: EamA family transporter [Gemmataceae bacterium]|nr:EamA family transporter [Gemmataceae bacterium]